MKGMDGFAMLDALPRRDFGVIFPTSHDEYAIRAIRYSALDYLLKPVDPARLAAAIERLQAKAGTAPTDPAEKPARLDAADKVFVREGDRCWFVEVKQIRLLESEGNYTRVHFADAQPQHEGADKSDDLRQLKDQIAAMQRKKHV